jgi:hypothetical protein
MLYSIVPQVDLLRRYIMTVGLFVLRVCCFHHSSTSSPAQQQKHFALSWKKMVLCWFGVVVPPEHFRFRITTTVCSKVSFLY